MPRPARTSSLVNALAHVGTATRGPQLIADHGRAALRRAEQHGMVHRLLPRIFAHRDNLKDFTTRVHGAMEWLPASTAITGLAACAVYGLIETAPDVIRAAAPSPLHVRQPSWLRLRRCVVASPTSLRRGVRVTALPHALVHAWEESPELGRDAIFTALRKGKVTVAEIREALDHYPHVKRRRRFAAFLAHLRDGMHSWLEYQGARTVLNTPDLVDLHYQEEFTIDGNTFYADRYHPASKTSIEFDGKEFHGSEEAQARDHWRDALFKSKGVLPVHLPFDDVVKRPAECRRRVRRVIAERMVRGSPP